MIDDMAALAGVRVLVMCGRDRIGEEFALELATNGAAVLAVGPAGHRKARAGSEPCRLLRIDDVDDHGSADELVDAAEETLGGIDVLIDAVLATAPLVRTWSAAQEQYSYHRKSASGRREAVLRKVAAKMTEGNAGRVIVVLSLSSWRQWPQRVSEGEIRDRKLVEQLSLAEPAVPVIGFDPGPCDPVSAACFPHLSSLALVSSHTKESLVAVVSGVADHLSGKCITTSDVDDVTPAGNGRSRAR